MRTGAENNTRVEVMYRDADNYKTRDVHVFAGPPAPDLLARLVGCLDNDGDAYRLKPEMVGLRHPATVAPTFMVRFPDPDVDHDWSELDAHDVTPTPLAPSDARGFADFVAECERASEAGWGESGRTLSHPSATI
ncbi:MAG TPA: hypothetical protein VHD87_15385 [Acidimicrobiales bacterium]|nr:hypothetical protein [Acidimicrobiales bacterium]